MERTHNAKKRIGVGLTILVIGGLLLLRNLNIGAVYIDKYIFRWEMIFIAIGIINLIAHKGKGPGLIFLLIGGGFYAHEYIHLPHNLNFWQLFVAAVFIIAGFVMIFKRKTCCDSAKRTQTNITNDTIDELAFFGGGERTIVSDNFRGGKIMAIFGGSNFNLSRSKLAPGKVNIDVFAVFGGLKLIVPEDWNVKVSVVSIFGGISDKHRAPVPKDIQDDESVLIIKGLVIFGGGEIKSF